MKLLKIASKRGLALLVTLMMCLSLLPGTAEAATYDDLETLTTTIYVGQKIVGMYNVGGSASNPRASISDSSVLTGTKGATDSYGKACYDVYGNYTGYNKGAYITLTGLKPGTATATLIFDYRFSDYYYTYSGTARQKIVVTVLEPKTVANETLSLQAGKSEDVTLYATMDDSAIDSTGKNVTIQSVTSDNQSVATVDQPTVSGNRVDTKITAVQAGTANVQIIYTFDAEQGYNLFGEKQTINCTAVTNIAVTVEDDKTYTVTYTDGVSGETVFPDQGYEELKAGGLTPEFVGTPPREGYTFMGWNPAVNPVVSADDANANGEIIYTAVWQKCEHPDATYQDNSNGTHTGTCPDCGETWTEGHEDVKNNETGADGTDGKCDHCGACMHPHDPDTGECMVEGCEHDGACCNPNSTTPECDHTYGYVDKGNGTHNEVCTKCGDIRVGGESHTWGNDDKCTKCDATKPTTPPAGPTDYDTDNDGYCDNPDHQGPDGKGECLHGQPGSDGHCTVPGCQHTNCPTCNGPKPAEQPEETYTVTFCAHDGTFASGAHEVVETVAKSNGATVTVPANPTRAGYDFKGWGVTGVEANQTIPVTGSVTYYAQWEKIPEQGEPELTVNHRIVNASKTVASGGVFTYQIIMQNTGTAPIENLMIQETLPPELRMDVTGASQTSNINVMATNNTVENELRVAGYSEKTDGKKYLRWQVSELGVNQSLIITFSAVATNNSDHDIQVNADLWYNYKGYTQPNRQLLSMSSKNAALYSDDGWGEWGVGGGNNTVTGTVTGSGDQPPQHTHSYTRVETKAPTCGADGAWEERCSCGDVRNSGTTPATGNHSWGETITDTASTCTTAGTGHQNCSNCNATNPVSLPLAPHTPGERQTVQEPAVGVPGRWEIHCTVCNALIDSGEIDALPDQGGNEDPDPVDPTPVDPTPVDPTPTPIPADPTPTTPTPADGGEDIVDENPPLASGVLGLNLVDHFAYVQGDPDGKVRPKDYITRAEVASIFFRLMTEEYRTANWAVTNDFTDANAGDWYNAAISTAAKAGLITGDPEGTYRPDDYITHAEFVALAARFAVGLDGEGVGDFKDTEGHWAAPSIRLAAKAGWITWADNGYFLPEENITRAEVMAMINRMLDRAPDEEHLLPEMKTWVDNPKGTDYYADVQEATNDHLYERVEESATESWTELAEVKTWSEKEAEWLANNGASAPEAAPETAE